MMTLSHSTAREWIQLAADGLLTEQQQAELQSHLLGCAECRAYAAELESLEGALRQTLGAHLGSGEMSPEAIDRLVEKVQKNAPPPGGGFPWPWLVGILGGLILLLYLIFGSGVFASAGDATATATQAEAATSTETPTPSDPPTASVTPSPTELVLTAVPVQNVNCREGNSSQFDIADTLFEGEEYSPIARGNDELWVLFVGPVTEVNCWVYVENLTLLINDQPTPIEEIPESLLPYAAYPPTPTPTPTPTFTPEPTNTPTPPPPECSDGIDNDGDQAIDYPADGRCSSPSDNSESR